MPTIHSLTAAQRPRERLLSAGGDHLSLAELVAAIIGTGGGGRDVLEVSDEVCSLLVNGQRSHAVLTGISGLGPVKAARLVAAMALPAAISQNSRIDLLHPSRIAEQMSDIVGLPQEHLAVFYLTVRSQPIARDIISIGTATASLIHPREVFRPAILHNASHIVIAHNHPSGVAEASAADLEATKRVVRAGYVLGIELLDHVICTNNSHVSLVEAYPELFF